MTPKILIFSGSVRTGSFNAQLAAAAVKELARSEAEVTHVSLADYPMPIYDGDLEAERGPPENAVKLKRLFTAHQGVLIASPEYNAGVTPLLKNTIDWISRVRDDKEPPLAAFKDRVFALVAASNGTYGGYRSLMMLRQILELGCGALVLPDMVALRGAAQGFAEDGGVKDDPTAARLKALCGRLVAMAATLQGARA